MGAIEVVMIGIVFEKIGQQYFISLNIRIFFSRSSQTNVWSLNWLIGNNHKVLLLGTQSIWVCELGKFHDPAE